MKSNIYKIIHEFKKSKCYIIKNKISQYQLGTYAFSQKGY